MSSKVIRVVKSVSAARILLALSLVFVSGCRLVITTDETGSIQSASGLHNCDQPSCAITITEAFTETFTAVPAAGYRFVKWEGVCTIAPTANCNVALWPLTEEFSEYDGDVTLSAVFESSSVRRPWYRDRDGDHYGSADSSKIASEQPEGYVINDSDCDDYDKAVHPWVLEKEDGRDNNCNGTVDEGFAKTRFYRDVDGDGFGARDGADVSSEPTSGYVADNSDCDDNNASIFPGARETFDSVDNNCNGSIDEGFTPRSYYRDVDGDGFGDSSDAVLDVTAPRGYVTNRGDNCVTVSNPTQSDLDEDGIGDACDAVDDRDTGGDNQSCAIGNDERAMLELVNDFRAQARVCGAEGSFPATAPLTWNCELQSAALAHSTDMANNNFFSHTGSGDSSPGDRITRAGYRWSTYGENIAAGEPLNTVRAVVEGWIDSPGHCANLMRSSFTEIGAAKYRNNASDYNLYWTQVFGRQR